MTRTLTERKSDFSSYRRGDSFELEHKELGVIKVRLGPFDRNALDLEVGERSVPFAYTEFENTLVADGDELRIYE